MDIDVMKFLDDYETLKSLKDYIQCIDKDFFFMFVDKLLEMYNKEKERELEVEFIPEGTCFLVKPKNMIDVSKIEEAIKICDKGIHWNNSDDREYAIKILKNLMKTT